MEICLTVTDGIMDLAFAGSFLKQNTPDMVVTVDDGLEYLKPFGLLPDAVVGDFDMASPDVLAEYRKVEQVAWEIYQLEKDETDTKLAIETVIGMGALSTAILGGTGGRIDHMLANIYLLAGCLERGISAPMVDGQNRLYILDGETTSYQDRVYGKYLFFIPLTERVEGTTLTGFKRPLNGKTITISRETGLCVSNELAEETGCIPLDSGPSIRAESGDRVREWRRYAALRCPVLCCSVC